MLSEKIFKTSASTAFLLFVWILGMGLVSTGNAGVVRTTFYAVVTIFVGGIWIAQMVNIWLENGRSE